MEAIKKLFGLTVIVILFVAITGFDKTQKIIRNEQVQLTNNKDTIPENVQLNLSKIMDEVGIALKDAKKALEKIDWNAIQKDIQVALKDVNLDKIFTEINSAIQGINTKEIAGKLKIEMNKTNIDNLNTEINKAFDEIKNMDLNKIQKEVQGLKIQIDPAQQENLKRNLEKIKPEIDKKMQELKIELEKLKKELKKSKGEHYATIQEPEYNFPDFLLVNSI